MPQPIDPFPIYRNGETKTVHGVDYPAWAAKGWTLAREAAVEELNPSISDNAPPVIPTEPTGYEARKAQLEAMLNADQGWRNIQQLAKDLGIAEKPAGGWADAIPLILEKEGLTP